MEYFLDKWLGGGIAQGLSVWKACEFYRTLQARSITLQDQLTQAEGVKLSLSTPCSNLSGLGRPRAQLWDEKIQ